MRKMFMMLAGAALLALSAHAQDLTIMKFADGMAPVIDGTVDPIWDLIDEVPIELDDDEDYGVTTVFDTWFKLAWNDTAFFLLLHRDDDNFADQWETGLADWQSDRDEIFFDVNVDTLADGRGASNEQEGPSAMGADYGHYQFTSIWVQDAEQWQGMPTQWYHNAPFYFGYNFPNENEYYTEYAFPFSSLTIDTDILPEADPEFQGADGVVFGLVITIADVDMSDSPTDETFRKFMRWVDEGGWDTMDSAGHVLMSDVTISALDNFSQETDLYVYPSPAGHSVSIGNLQGTVNITVYDITGMEVMQVQQVNTGSRIDISALRPGTYYFRTSDEETLMFTKF